MKPGPAVAQQLGPKGINLGKVISSVNEATKEFKGMKVPVVLDIDEKTKNFTVHTSSPPSSELLKKELNLEKGAVDHKNSKVGNASIEDVIKVAKIKYSNMLDKDFKTAVKTILGTCASIGIFVENKEPKELIGEVIAGKFDKEIENKSNETSVEKRKMLNEFFNKIKAEQEAKAQAAKSEEEAKAAAAGAPKDGEVKTADTKTKTADTKTKPADTKTKTAEKPVEKKK